MRSFSRLLRNALLCAIPLTLAACSTPGGWLGTGYFDSRPQPPPLPVLTANAASIAWSASIGKSQGYMFVPAVGEKLIYAANYGRRQWLHHLISTGCVYISTQTFFLLFSVLKLEQSKKKPTLRLAFQLFA